MSIKYFAITGAFIGLATGAYTEDDEQFWTHLMMGTFFGGMLGLALAMTKDVKDTDWEMVEKTDIPVHGCTYVGGLDDGADHGKVIGWLMGVSELIKNKDLDNVCLKLDCEDDDDVSGYEYKMFLKLTGGPGDRVVVVKSGKEYELRQVPAGALWDVISLIGSDCVVDPHELHQEMVELEKDFPNIREYVKISSRARVGNDDMIHFFHQDGVFVGHSATHNLVMADYFGLDGNKIKGDFPDLGCDLVNGVMMVDEFVQKGQVLVHGLWSYDKNVTLAPLMHYPVNMTCSYGCASEMDVDRIVSKCKMMRTTHLYLTDAKDGPHRVIVNGEEVVFDDLDDLVDCLEVTMPHVEVLF